MVEAKCHLLPLWQCVDRGSNDLRQRWVKSVLQLPFKCLPNLIKRDSHEFMVGAVHCSFSKLPTEYSCLESDLQFLHEVEGKVIQCSGSNVFI